MSCTVFEVIILSATIIYFVYEVAKGSFEGGIKSAINFCVNIVNTLAALRFTLPITEKFFYDKISNIVTGLIAKADERVSTIFLTEEFNTLLTSIMFSILSTFVFVGIFWILRVMTAILLEILYRAIPVLNSEKLNNLPNKIIGGVVGLISAGIFGAISIMPINNIMEVKKISLGGELIEDKYSIILDIHSPRVNKFYELIHTKAIGDRLFDEITKTTLNNREYTISEFTDELVLLNEEIQRISDIVNKEKINPVEVLNEIDKLADVFTQITVVSEEYKVNCINGTLNYILHNNKLSFLFKKTEFSYKSVEEFKEDLEILIKAVNTIDSIFNKLA